MVTGCANGSIKVADTSIRYINGVSVGDVAAQVRLNLSPTPRIYLDIESVELPSEFDATIALFDISLSSGVTFSVSTNPTKYEYAKGKLFCSGPFILANEIVDSMEPENGINEVQFGLLNFPGFLGEEYLPPNSIKEGYQRRDIVKLEAFPWLIEVRSFANTGETITRLRAEGGYGLTHEGSIWRADGESFSPEQVSPLLKVLRMFLSFARGANCGLTPVFGMNDKGQRVWETWTASRPSPWFAQRSWFDLHHGTTLAELFPEFYKHLSIVPDHHPLSMALQWYLLSNETQAVEGSIVLTQAALERLSEQLIGDNRHWKEGEWIKYALNKAGIPVTIPPELNQLREFAGKWGFQHGPHAFVEIRNDLVHSEMKLETPNGEIYWQARELGLWYVELMLLSKFGYLGVYGNRLTQEWRGQVEPVPWALDGGDPCPT